MNKKSHKQVNILGVLISGTNEDEVLSKILTSLKKKYKFFVSTPNPEIIVTAQRNKKLLKALNASDIAIPDGIGLLWAGKVLNKPLMQRIRGRELFIKLLKLANSKKLSVYLLGASAEVNAKAVKKIKAKYKNIIINGSSGFALNTNGNPATETDSSLQIDIVSKINKIKPDLLFVAFGAPKQEIWTHRWLSKLDIGGVMTVGGSLDYFSGKAVLVPTTISKIGLEWLWRLLTEPKRIGRIYNAVIIFPILVLKEKYFKK